MSTSRARPVFHRPDEPATWGDSEQRLARGESGLTALLGLFLYMALSAVFGRSDGWLDDAARYALTTGATAVFIHWALKVVSRWFGIGRTAKYLLRGVATFIGASAGALFVSAVLWYVLGHDAGLAALIAGYLVQLPAWLLFLSWWHATSPDSLDVD